MLIPLVQWNEAFDLNVTKKLALVGDVYISCADVKNVSIEQVPLRTIDCQIGPFNSTEQIDDAILWLDKGATRAVFSLDLNSDIGPFLGELEAIPRERLCIHAEVPAGQSADALRAAAREIRAVAGALVLAFEEGGAGGEEGAAALAERAGALAEARGAEGAPDFLHLAVALPGGGGGGGGTAEAVGRLHRLKPQVDALAPAAAAAEGAGAVALGAAVAACARSDRPDGLYTTVVVDELGKALGLVYSNDESISAAVECGRGVYWSRSRGGLWRKGDSSGAWQELRGIGLDCDSDALCFTVVQHGDPAAFCHLNRRDCWTGDRGLGKLERTLAARLRSAPAGSYTKRLFDDPALLRNKLLEEAQELVEAETPEHVASEAADLLYFLMARCAAAGVGVGAIEKDLDLKSRKLKRRPGNAKAHRIAAAEAVVGKSGSSNGNEETKA